MIKFSFLMMKLIRIFIITTLLTYPSIAISENINSFANKLFNHYGYDDKVNNYLKSFFSFGDPKKDQSAKIEKNFYKNSAKTSKHSIKIKSKNKMIYSFGNGQSLQINPSDIDNKIIYNRSPFSYLEIKNDSLFYGFKIDF